MNKTNHSSRHFCFYVASFLLPLFICIVCFALLKLLPFGSNTILLRDSGDQYIAFTAYLKTVFSGENDLLYTFSKNLGGEMVSLFSYYLLSPFNLLFAVAETEHLPLVFTAVIVLKMSFCGLTYFYASSKLFGLKPVHLAFSTAYALMAYNTIYGWNIMWLDGVLILPLLGLGLYKLWHGESIWIYCASLAYGLLTNFYIGYMLCIASVLFSVALWILSGNSSVEKLKTWGKFLFASCIGGFSTAFVWLPSFLSVISGRGQYEGNIFTDGRFYNFNILGLAGKVFAGACSPDQVSTGTPHIFCGIAALFLVLVFLFQRDVPGRKKAVAAGLFFVLLCSFFFRIPNIIWHGFTQNYAFNYRYAFLLSYVMLIVAQYALLNCSLTDKKSFLISGVLIGVLAFAVIGMKYVMDLPFVSVAGCLVSLVTLLVTLLCFLSGGWNKKGMQLLFLACFLLEVGVNYGLSLRSITGDENSLYTDDYRSFVQRVAPAVDYVKELDSGFYRMEKTFHKDHNDPMTFAYNGLSHFSSSQQGRVPRFMEKMGLINCIDVWSTYGTGSTAEADALLGVKYVLSESDLARDKGYELRGTVNNIGIYENPYVLGVAFLSNRDAQQLDMAQTDYFSLHNEIWRGITGADSDLLMEEVCTVTLENVTSMSLEDGSTLYRAEDPASPAAIRFDIQVSREDPLYYYFTAPAAQQAHVVINGVDQGAYMSLEHWDMSCAGTYRAGEEISIALVLQEEDLVLSDVFFYYEDLSSLAELSEAVKESTVSMERLSSSHFQGTFDAGADQLLLFTIPSETGWTLTVDGEPIPYTAVMDIFFAAEVPEGHHTFELRYIPRGILAGCMLFLLSAGAVVTWVYIHRLSRRNAV